MTDRHAGRLKVVRVNRLVSQGVCLFDGAIRDIAHGGPAPWPGLWKRRRGRRQVGEFTTAPTTATTSWSGRGHKVWNRDSSPHRVSRMHMSPESR